MRRLALSVVFAACAFENRAPDVQPIDAPDVVVDAAIDADIDAPMQTTCSTDCNDNDPCTTDACVGTACVNTMLAVPAGCGGTIRTCAGQSTCYLHCTTGRTWTNAETLCAGWSGHLVTIASDPENACVDTWLPAQGWIGYYQEPNDPEPAGSWDWISMQTTNYTKWFPTQPNNPTDQLATGQDCAYVDGSQQGQWYDHECNAAYPYVCER